MDYETGKMIEMLENRITTMKERVESIHKGMVLLHRKLDFVYDNVDNKADMPENMRPYNTLEDDTQQHADSHEELNK